MDPRAGDRSGWICPSVAEAGKAVVQALDGGRVFRGFFFFFFPFSFPIQDRLPGWPMRAGWNWRATLPAARGANRHTFSGPQKLPSDIDNTVSEGVESPHPVGKAWPAKAPNHSPRFTPPYPNTHLARRRAARKTANYPPTRSQLKLE